MLSSSSWQSSFFAAYLKLVNTIVPGPQSISYFIPQVLLLICLLVPPSIVSHNGLAMLAMPVILGSTVHAWIAMRGVDVISVDTLWWSFFFLVFKDPRRDFKRLVVNVESKTSEDPSDLSNVTAEPYPSDFWPRLQWVFALFKNRPLTSWKIGVASHDANVSRPYVSRSRVTFIKGILYMLAPAVGIIMPLAIQLKAHDSFFSRAGQSLLMPYESQSDKPPLVVDTIQRALPRAVLRPLVLGMYLYSLLILMFLPRYLLLVLASFFAASPNAKWSPHTWPRSHFGPFSAVLDDGLKGLWGRWWHQQMRNAVSEPGRWLATKLRLKRGGLARYACICISAFTLSGLTHMGLVPPEPRSAEVYGPWQLRLMIATFFWIQPIGILLEVTLVNKVITIASRRFGSAPFVDRILRLLWLLLFMSCSFTFLLNPFLELGYWNIWPPFFLEENTKRLLRGSWFIM
ncbi:hypothetical protein AC578_9067 [Pseudocercospora eumusae]|uniref:Wax synthase domain-containing protein n=1 Tax=Pseudocercospora eumusae TaxID=321146 RepID=A0A139H501_9PEZI|nr:hypothetical protein AC578_9067 [Pseudocercospora eumusae]